jgi:hypothetical protein
MSDFFTLKREAAGEPFVVKIDGETLTIPHVKSLNQFDLAELMESATSDLQFTSQVFKIALGDDFAKLRALGLNEPELSALFEAYNKHCGVNAGESSASSD